MTKTEMMNKLKDLHWYCIRYPFNGSEPVYIDIMESIDVEALCEAIIKYKSVTNYNEFYRWLSISLRGRYHYKSEYEVLVDGIHTNNPYKLDVWDQISPNFNMLVDLLNKELDLNFPKTELNTTNKKENIRLQKVEDK